MRGIATKKKKEVLRLKKNGWSLKSISLELNIGQNRIKEIIKESENVNSKLLDRRNNKASTRR
jgi:DNA-binding NarL/FixJ family response regulator